MFFIPFWSEPFLICSNTSMKGWKPCGSCGLQVSATRHYLNFANKEKEKIWSTERQCRNTIFELWGNEAFSSPFCKYHTTQGAKITKQSYWNQKVNRKYQDGHIEFPFQTKLPPTKYDNLAGIFKFQNSMNLQLPYNNQRGIFNSMKLLIKSIRLFI